MAARTPPPDVDDMTSRTGELVSLLPALVPALIRDSAPPGTRHMITAGGVVNADVLYAMITIRTEVPARTVQVCEVCGEPWRNGAPEDVCLRALPRLHDRLVLQGHVAEGRHLVRDVGRWMRTVKFALGLRTADLPIGFPCPLHADPEFPLVASGSEGFLRPDRTVLWQHPGIIRCDHCGAEWPAEQWGHLGRLLRST